MTGGEDRSSVNAAETLVARVALGDQEAFAELYDLVAPKVHSVVLRVLRDPAMAEEVTQEVMVELWRQAPRFEPGRGSAAGWAVTIAHRRAIDRVRSSQSSRDRDQREHDSARILGRPDDVAEQVEGHLERERVAAAMAALTPAQRESIELAYFSGYTYREVATALDVPEGTIKTRIRTGLIRMRSQLEVT
ncbi:MAG: ECF RNA polymerase sigma factor SigK [Actinomycetota bacterium]|nr:ECF RNA polymerase sigma factor SigK [Actinomycetota bacterium]